MNQKHKKSRRHPRTSAKQNGPTQDSFYGYHVSEPEATRRKALLEEAGGLIKTYRQRKKAIELWKLFRDAEKDIRDSGASKSMPTV